MNKLCDYGCGQEAKYQFKNGKWCCKKNSSGCPVVIEKSKDHTRSVIFENPNHILCKYGCGQEAKFKFKNGMVCCSSNQSKCSRVKDRMSKSNKKAFLNKKHTSESIEKNRQSNIDYWNNHPELKELRRKQFKENSILYNARRVELGRTNKGKCFLSKEFIEKQRQRMLNGGAAYINSFIQNPSKPQVELYNRIKEIYPNAVLNFPCYPLNYSLDIAIPELKICFESDGSYWHQDLESDYIRQKEVESLGWRMIRYKIDKVNQVPDIEIIKKDIEIYL